ncbi:hypothetical protein T484DRAFT_1611811, partial [Baffinella frigidus]
SPKPENRNPKPENRKPKPETRKPKPETRNPKPETRNQKPETRNPKPETRNPETLKPETLHQVLVFVTAGGLAQILVGLIVRPLVTVLSSPGTPFLTPQAPKWTSYAPFPTPDAPFLTRDAPFLTPDAPFPTPHVPSVVSSTRDHGQVLALSDSKFGAPEICPLRNFTLDLRLGGGAKFQCEISGGGVNLGRAQLTWKEV